MQYILHIIIDNITYIPYHHFKDDLEAFFTNLGIR